MREESRREEKWDKLKWKKRKGEKVRERKRRGILRREHPESSQQDPRFTGKNCSLPRRHVLALLVCSLSFFSCPFALGLMSCVWFISTCDSLCFTWWSSMHWSVTVTCFMFAMPTLFLFLSDSAISVCFLSLSCFVYCYCFVLVTSMCLWIPLHSVLMYGAAVVWTLSRMATSNAWLAVFVTS